MLTRRWVLGAAAAAHAALVGRDAVVHRQLLAGAFLVDVAGTARLEHLSRVRLVFYRYHFSTAPGAWAW